MSTYKILDYKHIRLGIQPLTFDQFQQLANNNNHDMLVVGIDSQLNILKDMKENGLVYYFESVKDQLMLIIKFKDFDLLILNQ